MKAFKFIKNEKGIVLIWFYLLIVILLTGTASIYALSFQESQLLNIDQSRSKAFYLAEAAVDDMLQQLRSGNQNDLIDIQLGEGIYSAIYCPRETNPLAPLKSVDTFAGTIPISCERNQPEQIRALAGVNGINKAIRAAVQRIFPPGVKASITANSDVSFTGSITIDGRNYVYDANAQQWVVSGPGTYGVSSTGTVTQGGSSIIGGNNIPPTVFPDSSPAIEQNATTPTPIYADPANPTPEEVLGVSPGSLDRYKTNTPPAPGDSGIFYLTRDQTGVRFGTADNPTTGILIVHNADGDATLRNVNGGYFKGLIIADDIIHINGTLNVIGGIVLNNSSGNTLGNGDADIKYSEDVLSNLPALQYNIISWEDTDNTAYNYS